MSAYLDPADLRALRAARGMTQRQLACAIGVTDKAVSKWETGRGLPDVSLAPALAEALGVSVAELISGSVKRNDNRAGNLLRTMFYVCPHCGNVVYALGEGSFSCCGATLQPLIAQKPDPAHEPSIELVDGMTQISCAHPMTKGHYLSFMAVVSLDAVHLKKLYPEQSARALFPLERPSRVLAYCNRHGLFESKDPHR